MTVSATENRKEHAGNGTTTSFATPVFFNDGDVVVYLVNDTTGASTQWTLNTQFTLSGAGNASGGTLTVETTPTDYTPASGETLVIITDPTYDQGVDLVNNDALDAEVLERALDELTVMIQRVDSKIGRAFRFADDAAGTDSVSVDIPTPEATKVLRWNSDGDALENINAEDLGAVTVSDFAKTLIDDPNADAFWDTLMASINKTGALTDFGFSSFIQSLIDDADADEARKTLKADSQKKVVTITPASDGDITLTAAQNASTVRILETGSWTAGHSLIGDDVDREFTVINNSGFTAPVTTSGTTPTTVDVPDGVEMKLRSDAGSGISSHVKSTFNAAGEAPLYACRAWCNIDGTGTASVIESGNISSVTDNGTGDYTVNFSVSMPDANYAESLDAQRASTDSNLIVGVYGTANGGSGPTASSIRLVTRVPNGANEDSPRVCVKIFR